MPGPRCCRSMTVPGRWDVRARIERFAEPSLLLLLREGPMHGYQLLERLGELLPDEAVDLGNLYRLLRGLEAEGIVTSEWRGDLPGPARRTYAITATGRRLLDGWADSLTQTQQAIGAFLDGYRAGARR